MSTSTVPVATRVSQIKTFALVSLFAMPLALFIGLEINSSLSYISAVSTLGLIVAIAAPFAAIILSVMGQVYYAALPQDVRRGLRWARVMCILALIAMAVYIAFLLIGFCLVSGMSFFPVQQ